MRKEKLLLLEKNQTKNNVGALLTYFTEVGTVWVDYVLTVSENNQKAYGYDPSTTKQTQTRDPKIIENNYVRYKDKVFHIPRVIEQPRHFTVILSEVNTANDTN